MAGIDSVLAELPGWLRKAAGESRAGAGAQSKSAGPDAGFAAFAWNR